MKRFLSMMLCFMMIFSMIASYNTCFAGIETIKIEYQKPKLNADGSVDNSDVTGKKDMDGNVVTKTQMQIGAFDENNERVEFNWNDLFGRYKGVIVGISGVAALTFLVFFIINFMKLGQSSGNPQMRSQALMGIVWCGIACAGLGGIAIFFGFFYNVLKN